MNVRPFIPKENPELPDAYGLKIHYVSGKVDEFELASHNFQQLSPGVHMLYIVTSDDLWNWIPLMSIQRFEWDKRWSKILRLKEAQANAPKTKN